MITELEINNIISLGKTTLDFGKINRITYHPDAVTLESDTDHTVMLTILACSFADKYLPDLNIGRIAIYCAVHDLVEVYAGDMPTLVVLSENSKKQKKQNEEEAFYRLYDETTELPWVTGQIHNYEQFMYTEARYVKAMDKLMPKITHILNNCKTLFEQGTTYEYLVYRYQIQEQEIRQYCNPQKYKPVFDLRERLIERVLAVYEEQEKIRNA